MKLPEIIDLAVIGAGPAGIFACVAARKESSDFKVVLFERNTNLSNKAVEKVYKALIEFLTEELKTEDTIIPIERLMEMGYLDETANIIKKCTEYRKEDRYKNVMEVRAAILKNMELIRRNML